MRAAVEYGRDWIQRNFIYLFLTELKLADVNPFGWISLGSSREKGGDGPVSTTI